MSAWQPIATAPDNMAAILVWNGAYVYLAWLDDDGWHDSTSPDHNDYPIDPQPTHWQPLPEPPDR